MVLANQFVAMYSSRQQGQLGLGQFSFASSQSPGPHGHYGAPSTTGHGADLGTSVDQGWVYPTSASNHRTGSGVFDHSWPVQAQSSPPPLPPHIAIAQPSSAMHGAATFGGYATDATLQGYAVTGQDLTPTTTSPDSGLAVSSDVSGSPSPGMQPVAPASQRPAPVRSPYEWMMKPSYQSQPNPEIYAVGLDEAHHHHPDEAYPTGFFFVGKTRTKDKYRVVYSDHQRLELEKEFHYSRYITIRRKSELAAMLGLSERQVKIWFQNRRAKERKQAKKREEIMQKEKEQQHHHHHLQTAVSVMNIMGSTLKLENGPCP